MPGPTADRRLGPWQALGNRGLEVLLRSGGVRAKILLGASGDPWEREADRVAAEILEEPEKAGPPREGPENLGGSKSPPGVLGGCGARLPGSVREFFETRLSLDLGAVRVHTGPGAAEAAEILQARAFTAGRDLVFGRGQFAPHTPGGQRLLAHELAHVAQQAELGPRLQREGGRSPVSVRFPTLEIAALRGQGALATGSRPLVGDELSDARAVFGSSIDLTRVRIVFSPVISAPTTLGDSIRIPPSYSLPRRVLIHELTHVWQYQTQGSGYISDSVFHQTAAWLTRGDRGAAYDYTVVPGQSFHDYTAEQQASIVEDYFAYPTLQANPEYRRLLRQVRAASPRALSAAQVEEAAAGLAPRGFELPPLPGTERGAFETPGVPLLEFRFPGL